jgi:hypothetical protein
MDTILDKMATISYKDAVEDIHGFLNSEINKSTYNEDHKRQLHMMVDRIRYFDIEHVIMDIYEIKKHIFNYYIDHLKGTDISDRTMGGKKSRKNKKSKKVKKSKSRK